MRSCATHHPSSMTQNYSPMHVIEHHNGPLLLCTMRAMYNTHPLTPNGLFGLPHVWSTDGPTTNPSSGGSTATSRSLPSIFCSFSIGALTSTSLPSIFCSFSGGAVSGTSSELRLRSVIGEVGVTVKVGEERGFSPAWGQIQGY